MNTSNFNEFKHFFKLIFPAFLFFISCSAKHGIERTSQAVERLDVEARSDANALIRHLNCDIYIEEMDYEKIQKFINSDLFINKEFEGNVFRIPRIHFFQIIIKNTGKEVINIKDIKMKYGNVSMGSLDQKKIQETLKSPTHKIIDYKKLLASRRFITDKYSVKETNYERDTLHYGFDFIPPSDSVMKMALFEWLPVQYRNFKIIIDFDVAGKGSSADFDFTRREYRTRGEHFLKPKKKIEEIPF